MTNPPKEAHNISVYFDDLDNRWVIRFKVYETEYNIRTNNIVLNGRTVKGDDVGHMEMEYGMFVYHSCWYNKHYDFYDAQNVDVY